MPATATGLSTLQRHARHHLLTRLTTRYAGRYTPTRVAEAVAEAYDQYAKARILIYVPLLAERIVRERLGW